MAYNQIYSIVNAATNQALGAAAVSAIDSTTLAEVGGQILTSENPATLAAFVYGLMGAINETRIKAKSYDTGSRISMWRSNENFGLYRRKIQADKIQGAASNSSYTSQDADYYDGDLSKNWTDRLFGLISGFETQPYIISRQKLQRCFRNPAEMADFINMLDVQRMNEIRAHMESCETLARGTAMGACFERAATAVDLGAIYNTVTGKATSATGWKYDADQIRFYITEMKRIIARTREMNRIYNNAGFDRFTRDDELVIDIHSDFEASMYGYMQNSLIQDFVNLPGYNKVTKWQGAGNGTFNDVCKLAITNDNLDADTTDTTHVSNSGKTVTVDGVIGFAHDYDRFGLTIQDLRTVVGQNTLQEMTTTVTKYDVAYAVDPSEQGIVFYVGAHDAVT